MSTRRLRALGVAVATVLLAGGCAAGTHPGAAAVVGGTEISVGDLDKTSRAVTTALGQDFTSTLTLNQLVINALLEQIRQQKSVQVTDAEIAAETKTVVNDPEAYARFQADPLTRDFLNQVAAGQVTLLKLGGGTSFNDPQSQAQQQKGGVAAQEAAKSIKVSIAPRFGQWSDGAINTTISGSLSAESAQAKAKREAAEAQQQQQQQQPQG
ncbi:hypothetical protein [Kribbella sp. NPDC055071]